MKQSCPFTTKFEQTSPSSIFATITVHESFIESLYQEALRLQKTDVKIQGFSRGAAPSDYLEKILRSPLLEHVGEFVYASCVSSYLLDELMKQKVVVLGMPKLASLALEPKRDALFTFQIPTIQPKIQSNWKEFLFRAPSRKGYRDLDKQVEAFVNEETKRTSSQHEQATLKVGDWVCFSLQPLGNNQLCLLGEHKSLLWLKITDDETDEESRTLFVGKKVGDTFTSNACIFQSYVHNTFDSAYTFLITIIDHIDQSIFSIEAFSSYFKLKTVKDIHLKLIEVFSYRNDISQRRETIELSFKTMLKHHHFMIPYELVLQKKELLLSSMRATPDYYVYKAQPNFYDKVHQLAEKQLKEMVLIDAFAYHENITITPEDIRGYFNLLKRSRTRDFVYFTLPISRLHGQELPVSHEMIQQQCLREKALNHLINKLAK